MALVARHKWITQGGDIGIVPELEFIEIPLETTNPTNDLITFEVISGELPPGIQVVRSPGSIQGVPVVLDPIEVDEARTYKFSIRARATEGNIVTDRSFELTVTNLFPPYIIPRITNLGTVFDGSYYAKQLRATEPNPNAKLNWKIQSGQLPPGISMSEGGLITGYIAIESADADNVLPGYDAESGNGVTYYDAAGWDTLGRSRNRKYTFTVQVSDGNSIDTLTYNLGVAAKGLFTTDQDHTTIAGFDEQPIGISADNNELSIDADNRYVPIITTPPQELPIIRQENFFAFKFDAIDFEGDDIEFQFRLADGSGFGQAGTDTFGWKDERNGRGDVFDPTLGRALNNPRTRIFFPTDGQTLNFNLDTSPYPEGSEFDINPDGAYGTHNIFTNTTDGYIVYFEDSSGNITILEEGVDFNVNVTDTQVQVTDPALVPNGGRLAVDVAILLPGNTTPSGSGFDAGLFDQSESKLPPTLTIDENGWLNGYVEPQIEDSKVYEFIIAANKVEDPTYVSAPIQYSLTILGSLTDTITWITPTDLGSVIPGEVSQLKVEAVSVRGQNIVYSLKEDAKLNIPQGLYLEVLSDGLISGRTTFRTYQMDSGLTTFDKKRTLFDNTYEITVVATTADELTSSEKTFTLRVNPLYTRPYENLYLKALPTRAQRQSFLDIVNNQDIFPDELIYRKNDPWFGRAKTIKFLALAGIEPSTLETYVNAMQNNHYNKQIEFGAIKTARAVDEFYNVVYEVVYLEVQDPKNIGDAQVNEVVKLGAKSAPQGGQFFLDQTPSNIQSFIDQDGNVIEPMIYPNTFENMNKRIIDNLGYSARGVFPQWMLDVQEDKRVLGFRRAVVLAYTVPGASKLIAYRLRSNNIRFGNIDFEVDRYQLDNILSKNFEIDNNRFTPSEETTFDRLLIGVGEDEIPITYAVEQSFESIHLRTRDYINNNQLANPLVGPGIDGVKNFKHGETLVFARQEGFSNVSDESDGWIQYQNTFIGDIPLDGDANELATSGGTRIGSTLSAGNSIWEFSNGTVSIQATGLPYHSTGNPQAVNVPQAQNYSMNWPNYAGRNYPNPTPTATPSGPIGFWLNGVAVFNPSAAGGAPFGYIPQTGYEYNAAFEASSTLNYSFGEDDAGGHAEENGTYHYHDYHFAAAWASGVGATDSTAGAVELTEISYYNGTLVHTDGHSKILGWSLDGYPIYGPMGYTDPTDATSGVTRQTTSWALKQNFDHRVGVVNDPTTYPLGMFIQDFEHVGGGSLDIHNGRYCHTPDYPNGTYAYFVTVDANGDPEYPYVLGPEYYGHAQPFDINSNTNGLGQSPSGTDLLAASFTSDYDGIFGYDSYKIIPGFREKSLTVFKTTLVQTTNEGSDTFDIPYQFGADFVGNSLQGTTGFTSQTKIIQQSTVDISQTPGVVNLVTRLVTNLPTTVTLTAGTEVQVINAMESDEIGIGDTIGISAIPNDLKVGMLVQGDNIPADTYIYSIDTVNSRIAVNNSVSNVLSGTVIRYLQTNQRGGVWRINIAGSQRIVNFTHVADHATAIPYADLQGHAWSTFLTLHPEGLDGVKEPADINGKRIVFTGPIDASREQDWKQDELFDLLQYDPLLPANITRAVPTHQRRQIWQIDLIETDNVISVRIDPSEVLDSDTFDEDLGFKPVILNKEYIVRLTLIDDTVTPDSRVRIRLGSFKDKDLQLSYDESWAIMEPIESDEVVKLEFVREIEIGQKVKVGKGNSWGFSFLTYDATLDIDQTVPRYKYWENGIESVPGSDDKDYTKFDGGGTRFFDYRDNYHDPEDGDKYLKFPQIGVFT